MTTLTSLQKFLAAQNIDGDLSALLIELSSICKSIADTISHGAIIGAHGAIDSKNIQGEAQKKLDVISNDAFIKSPALSARVAGMASEEMDNSIAATGGKYLLTFDPLDGSSNIEANISVGTIFSVLECPSGVKTPADADFLQPGTRQAAAGYALYGPATKLVITTGNGVNGFTLDPKSGDFLLTHPDLKVPQDTSEYAINSSNARFWEPPVRRYISECKLGKDGPRGRNFNMRWVASMVAEIHRILTRGGIFMYPRDYKDPSKPGRLRLMYEANPMAMIIEQAGGAASTGTQRILEVTPDGLHQRVPVIIGSRNEVAVVERYYAEYTGSEKTAGTRTAAASLLGI